MLSRLRSVSGTSNPVQISSFTILSKPYFCCMMECRAWKRNHITICELKNPLSYSRPFLTPNKTIANSLQMLLKLQNIGHPVRRASNFLRGSPQYTIEASFFSRVLPNCMATIIKYLGRTTSKAVIHHFSMSLDLNTKHCCSHID